MSNRKKVIIMGAAGRDFHNFNVFFRKNPDFEVVAFTATQIPDIAGRCYPPELSGELYPDGISIYPEDELFHLIKKFCVDDVVFAYSDLPYAYVMEKSAVVNAAGANFVLMGPNATMLSSSKPVIAVCAVRTGCGKSQISRTFFQLLRDKNLKVASIRHPMPYDRDLTTQICQRFASYDDLDKYNCTIEEREEYEPYIDMGGVIFAGVDYEQILREAEKEADIIIWDGGNNDFSFIRPDFLVTIADPHRPGHEISYYPGEVNVRMADLVVINKVNTASKSDIETVERNIRAINSSVEIIQGISSVVVKRQNEIEGKKVLVIEDGPTVTHGEMKFGAGMVAAQEFNAGEIIDPRKFAVGSIINTFKKYKHLTKVLPAMGYGKKQIKELEQTINNSDVDLVISGTPIDLNRVITSKKPIVRVRYGVGEETVNAFKILLDRVLNRMNLS